MKTSAWTVAAICILLSTPSWACPALETGGVETSRTAVESLRERWSREPAIETLVEGALGENNITVEPPRWRSWLPEVELRIEGELKSARTRQRIVDGNRTTIPVGKNRVDWQIFFWWDLSATLFDTKALVAPRIGRELEATREALGQEIGALQAERRRLMWMEAVCGRAMSRPRRVGLALRIEALTARIEALTGMSLEIDDEDVGGVGDDDGDDGVGRRVGGAGEAGRGGAGDGLVRP